MRNPDRSVLGSVLGAGVSVSTRVPGTGCRSRPGSTTTWSHPGSRSQGVAGGCRRHLATATVRTGYADSPLHAGRAPRDAVRADGCFCSRDRPGCGVRPGPTSSCAGCPTRPGSRVGLRAWFRLAFERPDTMVCGALKEAVKDILEGVGPLVAGGKGGHRATPRRRIRQACEPWSRRRQPDLRRQVVGQGRLLGGPGRGSSRIIMSSFSPPRSVGGSNRG